MKKSILTFVLMLTAIVAGAQGFMVDGISYKITSGDSVMVTSYSIDYGREVAIPSVVTFGQLTYKVTAIADRAFNSRLITSISIPASIESVGDQAFSWNDSLKTVILEDGDNPITLNDYSFSTFDNGGAKYTVYSGRNIIRLFRPGESPFPQATSITWGPKVTEIGMGEARCYFLTKAFISNSVKTICTEAFCDAGISSNSTVLEITMGANVDSIGNSAFLNCSKLKSIEIPKVLKAIPDKCFDNTRISEVVVPASAMYIGDMAFSWNDSLKTIIIEDSEQPITFNDYSFTTFDNGGAKYTVYSGRDIVRMFRPSESPFPQATSIVWGNQVVTIGNGEAKSPFLRAAVISNSVRTIGASAFEGAGNNSDVDELLISMGSYVDEFGPSAFSTCYKLKTIEIPKVLKAIPDNCFNSTRIKEVVIPSTVSSVGDMAFSWNDSIKTITILRNAVIGNSVRTIGVSAFEGAGNNSDTDELLISMSPNVVEMGSAAFYTCYKLKTIVLPKVLMAIPDNCFNSTRIQDVVIPASVMSVGDQAFSWNDSIKTIRIEDSDMSISFNDYSYPTFDNGDANYTVYQGRNIERTFRPSESPFPQAVSVAFGAQVTELGSGMYNCVNIKNIIAPWETPISINSNVFNYDLYGTATLSVPHKLVDTYRAALVWQDFLKIEEMEEVKCFTPTATLENGRLHFECETKDVTFHYKYTYPEGREGTGNDVAVGQTIYLTLYATKVGLEDSDKAYYELEISGGGGIIGIKGDVNEDGIVNGTDIQEVINIIVNAD